MAKKRDVRAQHASNQFHYGVEQCMATIPKTGGITMLDVNLDDVENRRWYPMLREHGDELAIHIRFYHPNWRDLIGPSGENHWAKTIVAKMRTIIPGVDLWDDPFVLVSVANEPNIEPYVDNSVASYITFATWHDNVWSKIDTLLQGKRKALSLWAAFAYGHEPAGYPADGEYTIPEVRRAMLRMDVLAFHDYSHYDWENGIATGPGGSLQYWHGLRAHRPKGFDGPHDIGGCIAQFPDHLWVASEGGFFANHIPAMTELTVEGMKATLAIHASSGRVLFCSWFIWNSGPEHLPNLIWPNERLRKAMAEFPGFPTTAKLPLHGVVPAPVPVPPMTADRYRRYVVQAGDTLWGIAGRELGRGARWPELMRAVPMGNVRELPPGAEIMIPEEGV